MIAKAAGSEKGMVELEYGNGSVAEVVDVVRVDEVVGEGLLVLSADTQGTELEVLKGASGVFEKGVAMVWVEIIACNERAQKVLKLLDGGYVLFDFALWGKRKSDEVEESVPKALGNFVGVPEGKRGIDEYWEWMCQKKQGWFQWLQSDILAVNRELMRMKDAEALEKMAETICGKGVCRIRELIDNAVHDEL